MKAIQFNATIPRYAVGLALGKIFPPILWSGLSCIQYTDVPEPRLPNDEWVRIKTRYGGICGSDKHLIHLHNAPSGSAITAFPFILGHENVGTLVEVGKAVDSFAVGDRVVVEPTLSCEVRGIKNVCRYCAQGERQRCENVTEGILAPGLAMGVCRDTGGSWSPYFVAHQSQLARVPGSVSDENAVLVEPFATSLHAVLRNMPREDETVLVLGAGVIGLGIIAALRGVGSKARIVVLARYPIQQELAKRFGAEVVVSTAHGNDYYTDLARIVDGKLFKPMIGKRVLVGGADVVYECVGHSDTIDDALRFARAGGRVIMVGLASLPRGVDWTPIWMNELRVLGTYIYSNDELNGERWRTFDLALDLMKTGKTDLSPMVTHRFALSEYARAIETINHHRGTRVVKAVFEFD